MILRILRTNERTKCGNENIYTKSEMTMSRNNEQITYHVITDT